MSVRGVAAALATVMGIAVLPLLPLLPLLMAAPAHAADYYRYWAVFETQGDAWTASQEGAGTLSPDDGATLGFRFAAPDAMTPNVPRNDPATVDFDTVCGDAEPESGSKRVAVIVDYGVEEDSEGQPVPDPLAGCAEIGDSGTALQALESITEIRTKDSGSMGKLLCGISGYPADGCADQVVDTATPADDAPIGFTFEGAPESSSSTSADATDQPATDQPGDDSGADTGAEESSAGTQTLVYVGLGLLVIVLLVGGVVIGRRRGSSEHR